jgi:enoyl-CoA hydratase/carnithine racemase
MSRQSAVDLDTDGRIGLVSLNRPEAMNAISGVVADDLWAAFNALGSRSDIWVVILRAEGDKAFCVGADLKERALFSDEDFHVNRRKMRRMFAALRSLPQPTIAAIFGFALGGGFELALSCDLIVAADDSVFGLPEVGVGLLPAGGATQLLPRKVGLARAKELIFTKRRFGAEEAVQIGLASRAVGRGALDTEAIEAARVICSSSPVAVREAKRSLDSAMGTSLEEGIEIENSSWERVIVTEDRREGIAAFNEKRDPRWENR